MSLISPSETGAAETGGAGVHDLPNLIVVEGGGAGLTADEMQGLSIFSDVAELGGYLGGTGRAKLVWKSIMEAKNPFEDEAIHPNTRMQLLNRYLTP